MQKTAAGRQDADKWHTGNCHLTDDKNHWRKRRITSRENGVTSDSDFSWTKLWLIPLPQSAADKAYTRESEFAAASVSEFTERLCYASQPLTGRIVTGHKWAEGISVLLLLLLLVISGNKLPCSGRARYLAFLIELLIAKAHCAAKSKWTDGRTEERQLQRT